MQGWNRPGALRKPVGLEQSEKRKAVGNQVRKVVGQNEGHRERFIGFLGDSAILIISLLGTFYFIK